MKPPNTMNVDWDDNEFPLAYLITIRTFGTWLHGDDRGSVDLRGQNAFDAPRIEPNQTLRGKMAANMAGDSFLLDAYQRTAVEAAIREVCDFSSYGLHAIHVRTNHAHVVSSSATRPELMATKFKSYATRRLRSEGLANDDTRIWSRGESTRYLWKERQVEAAIDYVLYGQGDELPRF